MIASLSLLQYYLTANSGGAVVDTISVNQFYPTLKLKNQSVDKRAVANLSFCRRTIQGSPTSNIKYHVWAWLCFTTKRPFLASLILQHRTQNLNMAVYSPNNRIVAHEKAQKNNGDGQIYNHSHDPMPFEPVAIIGMAMRLPGRVRNENDFWDLLSGKQSGLCEVPKDRFNIHGFHDSFGHVGTIPINRGYFLEDVDIQQFDTTVFPIPKAELERLDPSQRQLLQGAYECFESAGISSWRGSSVGCYVGEFGEDWADLNAKEPQHKGGYRATGFGDFAMSNRVSYEFDLRGPSMTVKTACSSSLVCLDLACLAIRNGECDSALVGGTSLTFSPTTWIALNDMGLLSPMGQCRTFDAEADGYARGEAVNMVLVKKLTYALRDKDPIRAVIRGIGVNSDGRTPGMLTLSPLAQAALIRRTYAAAGIKDLSETAIVECHGTGTPVGDPLEAQAVADCFGDEGIVITSVRHDCPLTEVVKYTY